MSLRQMVSVLVFAGCACATAQGPEVTARTYAEAIREGRLEQAYAMTSAGSRKRINWEAFQVRYQAPAERARRAAAVEQGMSALKAEALELEVSFSDGAWQIEERSGEEDARQAVRRFVEAIERADFDAAYQMLAGPMRAQYTPTRLREDFTAEPLARERLVRALKASQGASRSRAAGAEFPLGPGKAVRLVREADGFKIAGLE